MQKNLAEMNKKSDFEIENLIIFVSEIVSEFLDQMDIWFILDRYVSKKTLLKFTNIDISFL